MKNLIKLLILMIITSVNLSLVAQDKDYYYSSDQKNNPNKGLFSLTPAPKVSIGNLVANELSMLLSLGDKFKFRENILQGLYDINFVKDAVTITIYNNKADKLRKANTALILEYTYTSTDGYNSLSMKETTKNLLPFETPSEMASLRSGLITSDKIIIDKEILNFGSSQNYGKILNKSVTVNNTTTTSNRPSTLFGDVTDGVILPHFTQEWNGQVMVADASWNRIISFDKELISQSFQAIGNHDKICSGSWSFNYPTGIDYGEYTTTSTGCWTYKNYPIYVCDKTCGKIVKFNYRFGYCAGPPQQWHLAPPENWSVLKANLKSPFDIASHSGDNSSYSGDDVIWYSEYERSLVCLNANTGQELQRINSIYYMGVNYSIKPTRLSVYRSPNGNRNVLVFIDAKTNIAFYLRLNKNGLFPFSTPAAFSAFGYTTNKVESILITSNNNGLDGATVWGVCNDENQNGYITNSSIRFLNDTYPVAEHLGFTWIGKNSNLAFKNIKNLHGQNGFVDLFTMESWDNSYGIRRYKPGVELGTVTASRYCADYRYMLYTVTLTNPSHVSFSGQWKSSSMIQWENCPITIDGIESAGDFYLPGGTSTLIIRTNQFNNRASGEIDLRISAIYSPQDEDFNSSNKILNAQVVDVIEQCGSSNGGCPYLYTFNGEKFQVENNILHKSEFAENQESFIVDKYLLKVKPFIDRDNTLTFKIREQENDYNMYDYVGLQAVDHPVGSLVGVTEDNEIVLYYPNTTISPTEAVQNNVNDVTEEIQFDTLDIKTLDGQPNDEFYCTLNLPKNKFKNSSLRGDILERVAVIMDINAIAPVTPVIKDYAGFLTGYNNAETAVFPTIPFSERENPYVNIIPISDTLWIDSATIDWNRDYSVNYLATVPIYYGGYEISDCMIYWAEDSLQGDVIGSVREDDNSLYEFYNNSHITLKFTNTEAPIPVGYIRDYVFIVKGRYYSLGEDSNVTDELQHSADKTNLFQNYPNPFNPTTNIKFFIKNDSHVKLEIYDILGKRIALLVDGFLKTGIHDIAFDGTNLASGIYFYKITNGDFQTIKKMTLIK